MSIYRFPSIGLALLFALVQLAVPASSPTADAPAAIDTWPQFRGPGGDGHHGGPLPLHWGEDRNLHWKTPIHGKGWASPVIWGDQVWLATATEDGRQLSVVAVDRETGVVLHDLKLFEVETPQFCHRFNSYASPTPVIEEGRIYVVFGSPGIACVDTRTGELLWQRRDFSCNHFRGAGASPILYRDLLILPFDGSDQQYIVALHKATGRTAWLTPRSVDFRDLDPDGQPKLEGDLRKAYATPHVANFEGTDLLLSSGAMAHYAYDPVSGRELWRVEDRQAHSASTRTAVGHGLVYVPTGWPNGQLLAIRPHSLPQVLDVQASDSSDPCPLSLAWQVRRSVPRKPSVLVVDDLLFMIDDGGIATCLDARTGQEVWRERVAGDHSASPICASGRIYFCNETGKTAVVAATRDFNLLAENHLNDGFMASPAAAGTDLFLRSRTHLYCIRDTR